VKLPDGTVVRGVPDGFTKAQLVEKLRNNGHDVSWYKPEVPSSVAAQDAALKREADTGRMVESEVASALSPLRGIKDVIDTGASWLARGISGKDEQARVDAQNKAGRDEYDAATKGSMVAPVGRFGGNMAATAPVGGLLAAPLSKAAPALSSAIRTGGMTTGRTATGLGGKAADLATRMAGGAITGGASAGLVDPEYAATGAVVGAATPPVLKGAGAVGHAIGRGLRGGGATPEVAALANRAKDLGIDIPADRLVNSKPLDAVASGLNYVPFSGRAASEARMNEQLNRAASRLMGQDTPNINKALRDASIDLGNKFDQTLRNTGVSLDQQLLHDAADVFNTAQRELGSDSLKAISSQIDELFDKGASGVIDGQAAYNIKRTLDRIGRRNTPEAYHALELKRVLMDALDRSLGPQGAQAFAQTRQQYGNMLALEKLAKNGVEGEISVARLANLSNINNQPLQELADIAAQFVKPREGQHGAMQRAVVGLTGATVAGPVTLGAGVVGGRAANAALNSNAMRNFMLAPNGPPRAPGGLGLLGYRGAPLLVDDR
jgi:hypothetical protein